MTKGAFLSKIGFDCITAIRYIAAFYLNENEIPKRIGALSPESEKHLEEVEATMVN